MGSRDAAEALAEGQRAARSAALKGRATPHKLWPKANAQPGARPGSKRLDDLMSWISALYPNRIGKIASRSKPKTKSAPAIRANEKTGNAYHSGQ